ncbi:MAG: NUDIX domain-containing protein [Chryseobacterium sp.]|nr:MAG: NUDIX domain-containing protein [Chryseobacterium sp.]
MIDRFNVRVYGLCVKDHSLLLLKEEYAGEILVKLPGGGLEFGEGITDCLHREFKEELNVKIKILRHFYTQEDFVKSKFRANEQLLTVYYLVEIVDPESLTINDSSVEKCLLHPLTGENILPLPVDRVVFEKAKNELL